MMTLPRILLVEDNPMDAELAFKALTAHHLANEILHLRDGAEALDFLFQRGVYKDRPDGNPVIVLLDLKMPRVDGIEVLRQLKADAVLKTIPVVVMTSSREDQDLIDTYQLGVNAYVVKPVKFHEFVDAVKQVGAFWGVLNQPPLGSAQKLPCPA